jgi:penicillin-binding protein 1C
VKRLWKNVAWTAGIAGILSLGIWGWLEASVQSTALPSALLSPPVPTRALLDKNGMVFAVIPTETARESYPVPLHEMGRWLPEMTVCIEDRRFYRHDGVDFRAMAGAGFRNLRDLRIVSGASTITQQLVKMTSGRMGKSIKSKIHEAMASWKLEGLWTKDKILSEYMNRLDYGNRRIGPAAAASAYFGKSPGDLSLAEAIYLAGLPQSPTRLNPWKSPEAALRRYEKNVRRLAALGVLPVDAQTLLNAPPRPLRRDPPSRAPHFAKAVLQRTKSTKGTISTSLDLAMQSRVERLISNHLASSGLASVGNVSVVVIENATGLVRAYAVSGTGLGLDAAMLPRSCGSTLKPFLYLAGIDKKMITAASLLPDTQDAISREYLDYDPKNYSLRYFGPVRVREALGNSMNVPAVGVLARMGARNFFDSLRAWGFSLSEGFSAYGAGFILGNAPVSATELAAAYAGIARGGHAWPARMLPTESVETRVAASPDACRIVTDILCDNDARARSFGTTSPLNLPWRTAVKTGTSSGFRDGWCAGFNQDHTVAVWSGNLDGRSMGEILAVRSSAPLWAAIMKDLYGKGDRALPETISSETLTQLDIDPITGLLPRPGKSGVSEWFLAGTEPTESAETWYENNRLILPVEYTAWCAGGRNRLGAIARHQEKLTIIYPPDGTVFEWNPAIALTRQQFQANAQTPDCQWFLNGQPLDSNKVPLAPGTHTLTAKSAGQSAMVTFSVK